MYHTVVAACCGFTLHAVGKVLFPTSFNSHCMISTYIQTLNTFLVIWGLKVALGIGLWVLSTEFSGRLRVKHHCCVFCCWPLLHTQSNPTNALPGNSTNTKTKRIKSYSAPPPPKGRKGGKNIILMLPFCFTSTILVMNFKPIKSNLG